MVLYDKRYNTKFLYDVNQYYINFCITLTTSITILYKIFILIVNIIQQNIKFCIVVAYHTKYKILYGID